MKRLAASIVVLFACGGPSPPETPAVKLGEAGSQRTTRVSPVLETLQKGIAIHVPEIARVDLRGTAYANDASLFAAIRKQADVELPALALDAAGLSIEAAERRAGKKRASCWYGNPNAHTSNAGLGATVDERFQTSVHVVLFARDALEVCDRAKKIDEPSGARKHPSFWNWESSVIGPLASMSVGIVDITGERRKPEIATAWRVAWKEILALPREKRASDDAPDGEALASAFLGFLGRLVPPAEYDAAGKQLEKLKSPDAHAVTFSIVDLTVRDVLPVVLEQAELPDLANELRALDAIRSIPALVTARAVAHHAAERAKEVNDRARALCTVISPTLAEREPGAAAEEVELYLMALDAAYALKVPNLSEVTRKFFTDLVALATGR